MLTNDIGLNAGTIWNLLSQREYMTVREIGELTHFKETLIMLSLGWLSRENKITFLNTDGTLKIRIKEVITDIYY
ncbi:MAG: winged helix-turn-helix domain-containing protein [Dysgonomonas sp.]